MNPDEGGSKGKSSFTEDLFYRYQILAYSFYRSILERWVGTGDGEGTRERLKQADMNLTPELYLSLIFMNGTLVFVASLLVSLVLFNLLLSIPSWYMYALGLTSLATASSMLILPYGVKMRMANRKAMIDKELPFMVSELSIMASTGISPMEVIRRMATVNQNKVMRTELRKVILKTDVEGKDIVTSLGEAAKETPSEKLRELFWDLSNMIHQGGDFDDFLRMKADALLNLKRDIQKEFIDKLSTYADAYISGVMMMVLLVGIGAFLVDATGSTAGGLDAETLILLLTYIIVPISVFAIGMMVSMSYSKAE
ncbi:MAG: type II secretion system F family protein [Methanomassiliicoccales archaeon]